MRDYLPYQIQKYNVYLMQNATVLAQQNRKLGHRKEEHTEKTLGETLVPDKCGILD